MMLSARARMLDAVRAGLLRAELPDSSAQRPPLTIRPSQATPAEMAETFSTALIALTGKVHDVAHAEAVVPAIAGILESYGVHEFLSWDDADLGYPGLLAQLAARGFHRVAYDLPFDAAGRDAAFQSLEGVGAGLTGAQAALADSGAIVLASGPGRGRLASLLPPVHIAIVSRGRLFPSLPALVAAHPELVTEGSNLVVIAGPSRTADIEMSLTHGVHGPKHVHVILTA